MARVLIGWPVLVLLFCGLLPTLQADEKKEPAKSKLSEEERVVLGLTNKAREKEKLPPLTLNPVLTEVARAHSKNMAKQKEMEHELDGKGPSQRVKAAGYEYSYVGENIGFTTGDTPQKIFSLWMESPHHKENILRKQFTEIGVGVARNSDGEIYYTQVFGTPRKRR
jgi:uncharacterized protein YkwD